MLLCRTQKAYVFTSDGDGYNESFPGGTAIGRGLPKEPEWLHAMDTCDDIASAIEDAVGRLEATDRCTPTTSSLSIDTSPPPKRQRTDPSADAKADLRLSAAMRMRGLFTALLNNGRAEVRSYLHLTLMFILDRIKEFANRTVARGAGFDVAFNMAKSESELHPLGLHGIWDIPLAVIGDPVEQRVGERGCEENLAVLKRLETDFPCLSLEIRYQREVKQSAGGGLDRDGQPLNVQPKMWSAVDKVSLHVVAAHMLMELVSAKSVGMVLGSSKLSLRTIHILAVGLRALMLRSLESIEKKNCGFRGD